MLKYARGCVEINSIGNILLLPAIGKAVKENHNSYYNVEIHEAQAYGNLRLLLPLTRRYLIVRRCQWLCLLKKLFFGGRKGSLRAWGERLLSLKKRKESGCSLVFGGGRPQGAFGPCSAGLWWNLPGLPRGQGPSHETLALTAWALPPRSCQVCSEFNKARVICWHVHIGAVLLRGRG